MIAPLVQGLTLVLEQNWDHWIPEGISLGSRKDLPMVFQLTRSGVVKVDSPFFSSCSTRFTCVQPSTSRRSHMVRKEAARLGQPSGVSAETVPLAPYCSQVCLDKRMLTTMRGVHTPRIAGVPIRRVYRILYTLLGQVPCPVPCCVCLHE